MNNQAPSERQALVEWTGDPDELRGHVETLSADPELCDECFASKHEAFVTGLHLGAQNEHDDRKP